MFNKALFKQSCKANGLMWAIITVAECFMLSCVMCISGSGSIETVKNSVEDTIIQKEIDSQLVSRSLSYYDLGSSGLLHFDQYYLVDFPADYKVAGVYAAKLDAWSAAIPMKKDGESDADYAAALATWKAAMPAPSATAEEAYAYLFGTWYSAMPALGDYSDSAAYAAAMLAWQNQKPAAASAAGASAFEESTLQLENEVTQEAESKGYSSDSSECKEMLGATMYALKPTADFNDIFINNNETVPADYDVSSLVAHILSGDAADYVVSSARSDYREKRAENASSVFLADNMSKKATIEALIQVLSKYGVTEEKYESFGYTYASIKHLAMTNIVSYQARYDYELSAINAKKAAGGYPDEAAYEKALADMKTSLTGDLSQSLLASLPKDVADAIEDIGQMDLYSLIVGSIFFKIAGLLLPIIYAIMASNNLLVGQVDSGSMAYVLSTGTKRQDVTFTQGAYLCLSLFAMFACTLVTSCICFSLVGVTGTGLTYGKLCLINLGAFLVLFAISGINFLASCYFDRSKRALAVGGGLSIFFLVCTILGLFGSSVIPSVVRFEALNYFNYASIITLFDVISIIDGTTAYLWKFAILLAIGIAGYVLGALKFKKKDLPL